MKRKYIFAIIIVLLAIFSSPVFSSETIKWYSYDEGMVLGKSQQKKLFINFFADWCSYCTKMDKETYSNKMVISYLNKNFIPVKVNFDKEKKVTSQYKVNGLPTALFLSETGEQIGGQPGFIPADTLLPLLKFIQTDSYKQMKFKDFLNKKG